MKDRTSGVKRSRRHEATGGNNTLIRRVILGSLIAVLVCGIGGAIAYVATRDGTPSTSPAIDRTTSPRNTLDENVPRIAFRDITADAGIDFVHESGAYGDKLLPETMGGGCGFVDYDGDGDHDLILVNSSRWPFDPRGPARTLPTMALYQNDGHGNFRDVARQVGLAVSFYGMGVAAGDYDNDGDADLFFTAVGPNRLFRNDGGKFVDVTDQAGIAGAADAWSTSAGWFDYDNDGLLDLFVCNYVQWSREFDESQGFRLLGVGRAYGPPTAFPGTYSYLYHNEGGGKFRDVSREAGIQVDDPRQRLPLGKSLGVTFIDIEPDQDLDIVVANDTTPNFLFENQGNGTFIEKAQQVGIAFDPNGIARGSMGIHSGYFRNSNLLGIAIGNFADEMSALFVKDPEMPAFVDAAIATGFGPPTQLELTFGIFFFDYDLDGRQDILSANGHLEVDINKVFANQRYEQSPQLFWNAGIPTRNEFVRVPEQILGRAFSRPLVGRGAAYADIDGDGDLDVLITAAGDRPRLMRNEQTLGNHWLRVQLMGTTCNRDAIGATVEVHQGDRFQRQQVMTAGSYLTSLERTLTFGLGKNASIDRVVIHWPDGSMQQIAAPASDQLLVITQTAEPTD